MHGDRWSDDYEDRHEWHLDRIRVWLRALTLLVAVVVVSGLVVAVEQIVT